MPPPTEEEEEEEGIEMKQEEEGIEIESKISFFLQFIQKDFHQFKESRDIKECIQQLDEKEKKKLFLNRLEFGTAGLRGEMGFGFNRMNSLVIVQTTQGLLEYLVSLVGLSDLQSRGIIVGHDHRHNSYLFASLIAAVFLSKKVKVYFIKELCHTPLVPFGVVTLSTAAGIMITASHNPKNDNGYKLYGQNGCQIIPPHDAGVAASILQNLVPWNQDVFDVESIHSSLLLFNPFQSLCQEYYQSLLNTLSPLPKTVGQHVRVCYTPMHGVGLEFVERVVKAFQLPPLIIVDNQAKPDPEFPTVSFPNPEEKGALDLAISCAMQHSCQLVFANDPDADRFAVAEYQPALKKYTSFTGNQIGIVLASFMLDLYRDDYGKIQSGLACLTTAVSSHMLESMCQVEGLEFYETLTGFKWLGNRALELKAQTHNPTNVIFAFEEAIGYMCGGTVFDKDGVSALALFYAFSNHLYSTGSTVSAYLDTLYKKYGAWVSNNSYLICKDPILTSKIFNRIRYGGLDQAPNPDDLRAHLKYPSHIGGEKVVWVRDLTVGYDSNNTPDFKPSLPVSASSQMLTFRLANEFMITLRTSGTEPKIKYYTEYKGVDGNVESAQRYLDGILDGIIQELLDPSRNGL